MHYFQLFLFLTLKIGKHEKNNLMFSLDFSKDQTMSSFYKYRRLQKKIRQKSFRIFLFQAQQVFFCNQLRARNTGSKLIAKKNE